jgi:HPt (histidine-containing phosphotransfer) domain-containing protein
MMTMPTIDPATFAALKETTGAEFVVELVDTFLQEAPVMLNDLRNALAAQDAEKFRRAAHSLKSNANTFGALSFAAMARGLEISGLPTATAGKQSLEALQQEYVHVAAALTALRHA